MTVAKHLNLNMTWPLHQFLQHHPPVAKRRLSLAHRTFKLPGKLGRFCHLTDTAPAAACHSFDQQRKPNRLSLSRQRFNVLRRAAITRQNRNTSFLGNTLGLILQSHCPDRIRLRADPNQTSFNNIISKFRIFRQKPIARMDRVRAGRFGRLNHARAVQITLRCGRGPYMNRHIRLTHMLGPRISIGINRNRLNSQITARAHNPAGNFAAIGNEERFNHLKLFHILNRGKLLLDPIRFSFLKKRRQALASLL